MDIQDTRRLLCVMCTFIFNKTILVHIFFLTNFCTCYVMHNAFQTFRRAWDVACIPPSCLCGAPPNLSVTALLWPPGGAACSYHPHSTPLRSTTQSTYCSTFKHIKSNQHFTPTWLNNQSIKVSWFHKVSFLQHMIVPAKDPQSWPASPGQVFVWNA